MEKEKEAPQVLQFNNLVAPVAITLSLLVLTIAASSLEGREVDGDFLSMAILISLSVLIPACIGRNSRLIPLDSGALRVGTIALAISLFGIIANSADPENFNHLFLTTFEFVGFASAILNDSVRLVEAANLLSLVLGARRAAC